MDPPSLKRGRYLEPEAPSRTALRVSRVDWFRVVMFPFYEHSLVGTIIGGTIIPVRDCQYKGEHPKFRAFRKVEDTWEHSGFFWASGVAGEGF